MGIVTLLTDFGLSDEYVGVMKGVILSRDPTVQLVDISHRVPPQNVTAAAYLLRASWKYFPPGTVHVAVVDPGVGSNRRILAVQKGGHFFLAPDNGLLPEAFDGGDDATWFSVDNESLFLPVVSNTFHGRDIFAPVAAYISRNQNLSRVGESLGVEDLISLNSPRPEERDGEVSGCVLWIDHFGNLVTNISTHELEYLAKPEEWDNVSVQLGESIITGINATYSQASPGDLMALVGSRGLLEISVCMGDVAQKLGLKGASKVIVSRVRS